MSEKSAKRKAVRDVIDFLGKSTYYDWKKKLENGHYDKKTKQVRQRKIDKEALRKALEEKPDAYLYELAEPFGCTEQAVFLKIDFLSFINFFHAFALYRH